jgi:hypothetical protein
MIREIRAIGLSVCWLVVQQGLAEAKPKWTYEFLEACKPDSSDRLLCEQYIEGFLGSVRKLSQNPNVSLPYCLPADLSVDEVVSAVARNLGHEPFNFMAMEGAMQIVLSSMYPCLNS